MAAGLPWSSSPRCEEVPGDVAIVAEVDDEPLEDARRVVAPGVEATGLADDPHPLRFMDVAMESGDRGIALDCIAHRGAARGDLDDRVVPDDWTTILVE